MKFLRKALILFLALCMIFALAACGMAKKNDVDYAPADDPKPSSSRVESSLAYDDSSVGYVSKETMPADGGAYIAGEPSGSAPSGYPADGEGYEEIYDEEKPVYEAGLITASAWNENENYEFWKKLFRDGQGEDNGKFFDYYKNNNWGFDSTKRVSVTVKNGEALVCGATVACVSENGELLFAAKTGADGMVYLFPQVDEGKVIVTSGEHTANADFSKENRELEVVLDGSDDAENLIQIMLVIDVTGSMGDELTYFQTELTDVINRIANANDGAKIELALLFYRDTGDDEKFAYYDFVNVNDQEGLALQTRKLAGQVASGGGDYPEAVDEALQLAMNKAWSDTASTKIVFHLLDAPPHENGDGTQKNYEKCFENAVISAAEQGVRICPILCSGADELCEYVMRQASIYTGGTSIFVTDDSGIGGEHLDPDIPDMVVEQLNDLLVRLVNGYHTGTFDEPVEWQPKTANQEQ